MVALASLLLKTLPVSYSWRASVFMHCEAFEGKSKHGKCQQSTSPSAGGWYSLVGTPYYQTNHIVVWFHTASGCNPNQA